MMYVDFKKPWQIWPFQSYGMVKKDALVVMDSGDFTMSVSFKPGEMLEDSKIGGICLRPGTHTGFTIVEKTAVRFEFWYENNGENHFVPLTKYISDPLFFEEFNLLTVTFDSKSNTFKFYVNNELADSMTFEGKYKDYSNLPIFFGCGAFDRRDNTNYMDCYYDFFILCDKIIDVDKIVNLKENISYNLNNYDYILNNFNKNIVVCYDFEKRTPHKVWDFSGNSNYLIKVEETS